MSTTPAATRGPWSRTLSMVAAAGLNGTKTQMVIH